MLILKRNPDADQSESYNVFFEARYNSDSNPDPRHN